MPNNPNFRVSPKAGPYIQLTKKGTEAVISEGALEVMGVGLHEDVRLHAKVDPSTKELTIEFLTPTNLPPMPGPRSKKHGAYLKQYGYKLQQPEPANPDAGKKASTLRYFRPSPEMRSATRFWSRWKVTSLMQNPVTGIWTIPLDEYNELGLIGSSFLAQERQLVQPKPFASESKASFVLAPPPEIGVGETGVPQQPAQKPRPQASQEDLDVITSLFADWLAEHDAQKRAEWEAELAARPKPLGWRMVRVVDEEREFTGAKLYETSLEAERAVEQTFPGDLSWLVEAVYPADLADGADGADGAN